MSLGRNIKVSFHPLVSNSNIHFFEFDKKPFLYFIFSTRSCEIDKQSAFIIRQVLQSENEGNGKLDLDCGQYDPRKLRIVHDELMNELDGLLKDEVRELGELEKEIGLMRLRFGDRKKFRQWRQSVHRRYYIYLTRDCNMACRYCWNKQGTLDERRPAPLCREMIGKIMDFIFSDCGGRDEIDIILFGGEPLLLNPVLLEHLFDYGSLLAKKKGKKIKYLLDTNGTIWNDRIRALLKRHNVFLMVSIDGTEGQHDVFRRFKDGGPSHKVVNRNFGKMTKALPGQVGGRAVLGRPDFDLVEAYDFMQDKNLEEIQINYYFFSGYAGDKENARLLPISSIRKYKKHMDKLADYVLRKVKNKESVQLDSGMYEGMLKQLCGQNRFHRCFLGTNQLVIQTDGKIYPCPHMHTDELCVGNVEEGITRWDMLRSWAGKTIFSRNACRSCWARFSCGGRCAGHSLACMGNEDKPIPLACERSRYAIMTTAYLASEIKKIDPGLIEKIINEYKSCEPR